ncbi:MAG: lipoprotein [Pseudomonadota bacterium]|nr:lipoprotein [Pseudomonadota bacterium]
MIRQQRLLMVLLALLTLTGLTACGQKGPLYLPDDAPSNSDTETQS